MVPGRKDLGVLGDLAVKNKILDIPVILSKKVPFRLFRIFRGLKTRPVPA
jgi:hypothetical protein